MITRLEFVFDDNDLNELHHIANYRESQNALLEIKSLISNKIDLHSKNGGETQVAFMQLYEEFINICYKNNINLL